MLVFSIFNFVSIGSIPAPLNDFFALVHGEYRSKWPEYDLLNTFKYFIFKNNESNNGKLNLLFFLQKVGKPTGTNLIEFFVGVDGLSH